MSDWMKFYYATPTPDRFVVDGRRMLLEARGEATIAASTFLGRVMAANRERISEWLRMLDELPPHAAETLRMAAWLSCAPEASPFLRSDPVSGMSPPDLLAAEVTSGAHLDALWAWYCATVTSAPSSASSASFDGCSTTERRRTFEQARRRTRIVSAPSEMRSSRPRAGRSKRSCKSILR
jgi:hypothetical protein